MERRIESIKKRSRKKVFFMFLLLIALCAFILAVAYKPIASYFDTAKADERLDLKDLADKDKGSADNSGDNQNEKDSDQPEEIDYSKLEPEVEFHTIAGQLSIVISPPNEEKRSLPAVIYSHGSNEFIVDDLEDEHMANLLILGEKFAHEGIIFAASNMHGANYGNSAAYQDVVGLYSYLVADYGIIPKYNMIGYSMGAYTTQQIMKKNPDALGKMAFLAPVPDFDYWDRASANKLAELATPIQIWHGTKDVNLSVQLSRDWVEQMKDFNENVMIDLIEKPGVDHFQLKLDYHDELVNYFVE